MSRMTVEFDDINGLEEAILNYAGNAEEALNDVLHNQAGTMIAEAIVPLIHPSRRRWKGKAPSATSVMPFAQEDGNLSVTVGTIKNKKKYQYLYFPDDGSNTYNHAGNQNFMGRGAEIAQPSVINLCIARLVDDFNI